MKITVKLHQQWPLFLVGCGHGATHWIAAIFYVLLPFITEDLSLSYAQAGIFVAIFQFSSFLTNFGSGAVVDLSGRRVKYQIVSLLIGAAALIAFGLSGAYLLMCLMVVFIGVSNNLWHPAAIAFLSSCYPRQRGYALSIHALGASVGDAIAPLIAGALLLIFSWQNTALIGALPVLALAAVFGMYLLPEESINNATRHQRLSGSEYLAGIRGLLKQKAILGLCAMSAFRSTAQLGLLMFLPIYLVDELQASPVAMGAIIMAMHIAGLIASPVAGIVSDRLGRRPVVMAGLSATTIVIFALTWVDDMVVYISAIAVLGFVLYAVRPVVHSWLMDLAPEHLGASATSLLFATQAALSVIMPLAGGIIADHFGLPAVFYFIAAIMLCANCIVFLLPAADSSQPSVVTG